MENETVETIESAAPADVQARAEREGWIPPARYKGDVEHFIDADEFIWRGETILPIVKKQLVDTKAELAAVKAQSAETTKALTAAQEAIAAIEERHTIATQRAVDDARKQLKAELATASEEGRHADVAELTDQLTQLGKAEDEAPPAKKVEAPAVVIPPEFREWQMVNPWFGVNKRKTALALGIATELKEANDPRQGREFWDAVSAEVDKELAPKSPPVDRVEGSRGSGGQGGNGGVKTYAHLPADAKAACDADIKAKVGEGKRYKTAAEWRSQYASIYFKED